MCMTQKNTVEIEKVSAFKIFTRNEQGTLQSTFIPTFKSELTYPPNERIRVDEQDATFFAFESFKDAIRIARQGKRKWRMVNDKLVVLPVTMYEVVTEGKYHVPSDDIQCLDGYYPAYESKEIEVHDDQNTRNAFYDQVLSQYFDLAKYSMAPIEIEAFKHYFPVS